MVNKRPLCQAALLTAIGIVMYKRSKWFLLLIGLAVVLLILLAMRLSHERKKISFVPLLMIPFWIGMGMLRMEYAEAKFLSIPNQMDEDVTIRGVLYDKQEKEEQVVLYLKDVIFLANQSNSDISSNSTPFSDYTGTCMAYYSGEADCAIGNTIQIKGKMSRFEEGKNPGQFDAKTYYQGQGIDFSMFRTKIVEKDQKINWLKQTLYQIKKQMHTKLERLAGNHAAILQAMLLGEKSQMDSEQKELYQKNGISHILVISGLHFSMLGMCLYQLLRRFGASFRIAGGISLVFLFLYGVMTGFGVSAVRAFIMFGISIGAAVLGKGYDLPSALGASVLYLFIRNPYVLFQTGFLLSVGAILGILLIMPLLNLLVPPRPMAEQEEVTEHTWLLGIKIWLRKAANLLRQGLQSGLGIQIATFPILLYSFYEFSPYSILLNCLVIPLLSIVIFSAVGALLLSFLVPGIAGIVILPCLWILDFYEAICHLVQKLPKASVVTGKPEMYQIGLYYLMLVLFAVLLYGYQKKFKTQKSRKDKPIDRKLISIFGCICFVCMAYFLLIWQDKSGLLVAMLDVGQGQSIYIQSGNSHILYDGGSTDVSEVGKYRIAPFLKAKGVDKLELVLISHLDADHCNGIRELIEEELIRIDCLMLPKLDKPDESYIELTELANAKQIVVQPVAAEDQWELGDTQFHVLHPSLGYLAKNKNDTSIVMTMKYGDFTMLFTGDVEKEGEKSMLQAGILSNVDVLQVAHHGSNSSSTKEFLEAVLPETVLISCGEGNRYGHPSKDTLKRLQSLNCRCYTTIQEGCILFRIPEKELH